MVSPVFIVEPNLSVIITSCPCISLFRLEGLHVVVSQLLELWYVLPIGSYVEIVIAAVHMIWRELARIAS